MADSTVGALPRASELLDNDLLVLEQGGSAKSITGQILKNYLIGDAEAILDEVLGV